jgi:hypothetical protein
MGRHHHLLLRVRSRCLSLVHNREYLAITAVCSANPRVLSDLSVLSVCLSELKLVIRIIVLVWLLGIVARAYFVYEITIKHGLSQVLIVC